MRRLILIVTVILLGTFCLAQPVKLLPWEGKCGADQFVLDVQSLAGKHIALVANKSSRVGNDHLLDCLLNKGMEVVKVFCPEHGFRGSGDAGQVIEDHKDPVTGIQVVSLYGAKKKPLPEDLLDVDVLVFDIQDVGARFYTYISTLHYVMEAAAENNKMLIVLDRPNPNGFYVDGPIREESFTSFVGMHPIPVVHGMTIGEYARMINGEGWLGRGVQVDLQVIPCTEYSHQHSYNLPVEPSPNLPNQISVYLYPSLCFFEGTIVSIGRGTKVPFQVVGHPELPGEFHFRPVSTPGASLHPKCEDLLCSGWDMRESGIKALFKQPGLHLEWVISAYYEMGKPDNFFRKYFDTLAGNTQIREMIEQGHTADEIASSWQRGLDSFKLIRKKYLLYPDFE